MTEQIDLEAIEARCKAATEGPWTVGVMNNGPRSGRPWNEIAAINESGRSIVVAADGYTRTIAGESETDCGVFITPENAEFIARAREDVPDLIREVRILRERARVCAGCEGSGSTEPKDAYPENFPCGVCAGRGLPGWIPVGDQLPKYDTTVLITWTNPMGTCVSIGKLIWARGWRDGDQVASDPPGNVWLDGGGTRLQSVAPGRPDAVKVTHWRPLPSPGV